MRWLHRIFVKIRSAFLLGVRTAARVDGIPQHFLAEAKRLACKVGSTYNDDSDMTGEQWSKLDMPPQRLERLRIFISILCC